MFPRAGGLQQVGGQRYLVKLGELWWSLVDCSNDRKSTGHKNEQCLEDYYWRFGYVWKITGLGRLRIR